jgi:hypothetical protein
MSSANKETVAALHWILISMRSAIKKR